MRRYTDVADKTLVIVCLGCDRRSMMLGTWWPANAAKCGDDLDKLEARLRCDRCGGRARIDVHEPKPEQPLTRAQSEVLQIIGDMRRLGKHLKDRKEGSAA